jgi:hypothetical protein
MIDVLKDFLSHAKHLYIEAGGRSGCGVILSHLAWPVLSKLIIASIWPAVCTSRRRLYMCLGVLFQCPGRIRTRHIRLTLPARAVVVYGSGRIRPNRTY